MRACVSIRRISLIGVLRCWHWRHGIFTLWRGARDEQTQKLFLCEYLIKCARTQAHVFTYLLTRFRENGRKVSIALKMERIKISAAGNNEAAGWFTVVLRLK